MPSHLLQAGAHHGCCVIGCFDDDALIGIVYAFPVLPDVLYSHLAAIHPQHQGRGLGQSLKRAQADWARERGFQRISWTFDPLQARNAQLNIARLGATSNRYLVDYYGELNDAINRGVPTDRLEVDWWIDPRPKVTPTRSFTFPLTPDDRLHWRLKSRQAFQAAFGEGLSVVGFERSADQGVYWFGS